MSNIHATYRISELPDNLMISPKFLFDWWDMVIARCGTKKALGDKSADFRLARELWVAAVFACCKKLSSNKEHWVAAVSDEAPDALVAYFDLDDMGSFRQIYPIEVTEYDHNSESIEVVIKKKLDKAYTKTTRIVCYISRTDLTDFINTAELTKFIAQNNPHGYEVWVLGRFEPKEGVSQQPFKLFRLTGPIEDYQIDLANEKLVPNKAEAVLVPDQKSSNKEGAMNLIGKITLKFPAC